MGNRVIYLVRHGQYFTDELSRKFGRLTPLGRRQARFTGRRLAQLPIAVVHHSTMPRAVETAQILGKFLPQVALRPSPLLCEITPPLPSNLRLSAIGNELPWSIERQQFAQLVRRMLLPTAGARTRHEIWVTHGNLIRYVVRRVLRDEPLTWVYLGTDLCGITTVAIRTKPARACLLGFNDIGHLPADAQIPI